MPGRSKDNLVARCRPAMRVRSRIGRSIVRTKICLNFNDAARDPSAARASTENFAQQPWRNLFRRSFEERALKQLAGRRRSHDWRSVANRTKA